MDLKYIGCCCLKKASLLSKWWQTSTNIEKNNNKLVLACIIKLKTIEKNTNYLIDLICVVNENRWQKFQNI